MARIALGHVTQEYPHKLDHVLLGDEDALPPRALHPIFFGSFDWHSCVHGWWTLLTLRRLFPDMPEAGAIAELADDSFTPRRSPPSWPISTGRSSRGFERPYGWALAAVSSSRSVAACGRPGRLSWSRSRAPSPSGCAIISPILTYPIRVGTHFNTAFALILSLEWAEQFDTGLADADPRARARTGSAPTATARPGSRAATSSCLRR